MDNNIIFRAKSICYLILLILCEVEELKNIEIIFSSENFINTVQYFLFINLPLKLPFYHITQTV